VIGLANLLLLRQNYDSLWSHSEASSALEPLQPFGEYIFIHRLLNTFHRLLR